MKSLTQYISKHLTETNNIITYIKESISNNDYHAMHEVCLLIDNKKELTDAAVEIAKTIKEDTTFNDVANMDSVKKLANDALIASKMSIRNSEAKKELLNYVAATVLNYHEGYDMGPLSKDAEENKKKWYYSNINW